MELLEDLYTTREALDVQTGKAPRQRRARQWNDGFQAIGSFGRSRSRNRTPSRARSQSGTGGKKAGKARGTSGSRGEKKICFAYANGNCSKGSSCAFSHSEKKKAEYLAKKGGKARVRSKSKSAPPRGGRKASGSRQPSRPRSSSGGRSPKGGGGGGSFRRPEGPRASGPGDYCVHRCARWRASGSPTACGLEGLPPRACPTSCHRERGSRDRGQVRRVADPPEREAQG